MDKYTEIRKILSGRVALVHGAYTAASAPWRTGLAGMFSGSEAAQILGICRMVRRYQSESVDAAVYAARSIFGKLGHPVLFQSEPGLKSCFLRNYLGNPVVLTLEESDEGIRIDAYTARTVFSGMNLRHAFGVFEKHLPDDMRVTLSPGEENNGGKVPRMRESRRDRKARKKAEKLEKRAEKINARAQAAAQAVQKNDN